MYKSTIDIRMAVMDAEDDVSDSDEIDISPTTGDQQQDTEKVKPVRTGYKPVNTGCKGSCKKITFFF